MPARRPGRGRLGRAEAPLLSAPTHYVVLHESVRNHPGVCAVQSAHAAGESVIGGPASSDTVVIALVAETSAALEMLHVALEREGIHHVVIREPNAPYNGSATAVGLAPVLDRELVKPLLAKFKVLR